MVLRVIYFGRPMCSTRISPLWHRWLTQVYIYFTFIFQGNFFFCGCLLPWWVGPSNSSCEDAIWVLSLKLATRTFKDQLGSFKKFKILNFSIRFSIHKDMVGKQNKAFFLSICITCIPISTISPIMFAILMNTSPYDFCFV